MRISQTVTEGTVESVATDPRKRLCVYYVANFSILWMVIYAIAFLMVVILESQVITAGHVVIGGYASLVLLVLGVGIILAMYKNNLAHKAHHYHTSKTRLPHEIYVSIDNEGIHWGEEGLSSAYLSWEVLQVEKRSPEALVLLEGSNRLVIRFGLADRGEIEEFANQVAALCKGRSRGS